MVPAFNFGCCKQNSDFWIRITSLYGSQTSPVFLCLKNRVISIRNTSLYVFQLSSVFFSCKTAPFPPEIQVCMGPRPHLWFSAHITACLAQECKDYICSSPHLWFCACKTTTLGLELHVSESPRLYLWFLQAKQRLLDQNDKSLWVPDMTCRFGHVQQRA